MRRRVENADQGKTDQTIADVVQSGQFILSCPDKLSDLGSIQYDATLSQQSLYDHYYSINETESSFVTAL